MSCYVCGHSIEAHGGHECNGENGKGCEFECICFEEGDEDE